MLEIGAVQQIPLPDGDAIRKLLQSIRGTNLCRDRVTLLDRLPNNL
jgi:hypothetical protein